MKKILLIPLIAVAVALPIAPYHIGTTVEENFRLEHQTVADEAALSGLKVELIDYQRNYLGATASSRISVIAPKGEEAPYIDLRHRISHIPRPSKRIIASIESELLLSAEAHEILAPLFKGEKPLQITTQIFFDGHQEGTLHSPAARGPLGGEESGGEPFNIAWQGLEASAWQSATRDQITFTMQTPGLQFDTSAASPQAALSSTAQALPVNTAPATRPQSFSMGALHYEGTLNRGNSGLWMGNGKGTLASFALDVSSKDGSRNTLRMEGASMDGMQGEENGLINASGSFSARSINVDGFALSNAHYDIALNNIDATALRAWQQVAQQMMQAATNETQPGAETAQFAPLLEQLPALINAQPQLLVNDLSVDSPMGRFAIKLDSRIEGQWNDALLQNPAMLVTLLKAELDASLPRGIVIEMLQQQAQNAVLMQAALNDTELSEEQLAAAVEQAVQQQLAALLAQGFIKENAAQLETRIEYRAGQLLVNGQDASALMGMMVQ